MPHHRRNKKGCYYLYLSGYNVQILPYLGTESSKQPRGSLLDDLLNCKGSGVHFWRYPINMQSKGNLTQGISFKPKYVGTSLVLQWLRSAFQCRRHGFDP